MRMENIVIWLLYDKRAGATIEMRGNTLSVNYRKVETRDGGRWVQ
jgi:hypothetical protein